MEGHLKYAYSPFEPCRKKFLNVLEQNFGFVSFRFKSGILQNGTTANFKIIFDDI